MEKFLKFSIIISLAIAMLLLSLAFINLKESIDRSTALMLASGFSCILLAVIITGSSSRKKIRQDKNLFYQQIEEYKNKGELFRELSEHTQLMREEERTRIAREVHDVLGQQLTVMKMDASWINKKIDSSQKDIKDKSEGMLKQIDNMVNTVRKIASDLRPGILDDLGLVAALEWQCKDFQDRYHILCKFTSNVEEINCDTSVSTGVFRIFQEAFTNILRHAQASSIAVSLQLQNSHLKLSIRDNGIGIKEENKNNESLGLLGIKERTRLMKGEFLISGVQGQGTLVAIDIPLGEQH